MFHVNIQLRNYAAHVAVGAEACVTKTYERRDSCIWPTIKELLVLALHLEGKKVTCFYRINHHGNNRPCRRKFNARDQNQREVTLSKTRLSLGQDRAKKLN